MTDSAILGPIGQISRQVRDIDAAVAWYRDVLGLPHLFTFGALAFFDCHGVRLFLSAGEKEVGEPGDSVLYFPHTRHRGRTPASHRARRHVSWRAPPHSSSRIRC